MRSLKLTIAGLLFVLISACGSTPKPMALNIQSDPLGSYALLQVKYKEQPHADWIHLGTTPVEIDQPINFDNAISVSLKVIRPGFHERVKTWSAKEFKKEYKQNKRILWIPNLVKQ
jgi:hypothetical protein